LKSNYSTSDMCSKCRGEHAAEMNIYDQNPSEALFHTRHHPLRHVINLNGQACSCHSEAESSRYMTRISEFTKRRILCLAADDSALVLLNENIWISRYITLCTIFLTIQVRHSNILHPSNVLCDPCCATNDIIPAYKGQIRALWTMGVA
jgi:hypothetical protein